MKNLKAKVRHIEIVNKQKSILNFCISFSFDIFKNPRKFNAPHIRLYTNLNPNASQSAVIIIYNVTETYLNIFNAGTVNHSLQFGQNSTLLSITVPQYGQFT